MTEDMLGSGKSVCPTQVHRVQDRYFFSQKGKEYVQSCSEWVNFSHAWVYYEHCHTGYFQTLSIMVCIQTNKNPKLDDGAYYLDLGISTKYIKN